MITVLRLGHRVGRDDRISTHCGLVSRAFGASSIIYCGDADNKMIEGVKSVTQRFGGKFKITYDASWRKIIQHYKKKKFKIVHLTMYGMPIQKKIGQIRKAGKILLLVGSEKVPGEVYHLADYNIAVGSQPHSEVAALAVFLFMYSKKGIEQKFAKAKLKIVPQEKGKKVVGN
jgi:tRNA (cytidine56-2'-O)-methyltransferase